MPEMGRGAIYLIRTDGGDGAPTIDRLDPDDSGLVWRLHLASEVPPDEVKAVLRALLEEQP